MADDDEEFYRAHVARHARPANRWCVFIGDHLILASGPALLLRHRRLAVRAYILGLATTVFGHLAFEHNLAEELRTIARHPARSLRAERRFLFSLWRRGPSSLDPMID